VYPVGRSLTQEDAAVAEIAIVWDPRYALHDTGDHPEGPDRVDTIVDRLRQSDLWPRLTEVRPDPAPESELLLVHTPAHIARIRRAAELRGGEWIDPDTFVSAQSYEIALLAVGGVETAAAQWTDGRIAFAAVRPPGHHATPDRSMGFCLFNNVAVTARRLQVDGRRRIAIVDWDAHHGNGTQAAFLADADVLYVSLHQWPLYPGSGAAEEVGVGPGEGLTVNIPLPPGAVDGDYGQAFAELVEPIVRQFSPDAILVSAGFDTHEAERLAGLSMTEAGFAAMADRLRVLAGDLCEGRLAFALEGGYDRPALAASVEAVLRAVADETASPPGEGSPDGRAAVERARSVQAAFWEL